MTKRVGRAGAIGAVGIWLAAVSPGAGQEGVASTMTAVVSLESLGGVAIAPDGSAAAYTVRTTDWDENRFDTEIWLARRGEPPFQLTRTTDGSSTAPSWSPDGRWIAFMADRGESSQVHLVQVRGGEAFPLTELEGGIASFAWSPDGDRMALRATEPVSEEREATTERYGAFAVEDGESRMAHLWVLDVGSDGSGTEPERLTEGDFTVDSYAWSPDGTQIAFDHQPDPGISGFLDSDMVTGR